MPDVSHGSPARPVASPLVPTQTRTRSGTRAHRVRVVQGTESGSMTYHSILSARPEDSRNRETREAPACFADLNLDQIVDAITAGKQEYNLKPFFHTPLKDVDAIKYRHEIMQDLENDSLFENIKAFADTLRTMRQHLALVDKLTYKYHKQGWFLETVAIYCEAVSRLVHDLTLADLRSRGLLVFREYMRRYAESGNFTSLSAETKKLQGELSAVNYCLLIKGNCIKVRRYESEVDYSAVVEKTFEKFKQGAVTDYRVEYLTGPGMNHVEAGILDLVAELYPDIFSALDNYCARNGNYLDRTVAMFDREIQFYIAYLEYVALFKRAGLKLCYPLMSNQSKEVYNYEGFDLALAHKLITENSSVVCNDFCLKGRERILVVSGPNQGGKTTFARTFGQLHYLANIGCPVPGREAQLFLFDRLFTHFEKEEDINNLRGKLQDDMVRVHNILNQATSHTIIIMNEMFTSTTLKDAVFLGRNIMEKIIQSDLLCVCVTFIVEWASLSESTVSMVSTVVPENPAMRTYKIVRMPADGLAYAISIAAKYRLTYDCLRKRLAI